CFPLRTWLTQRSTLFPYTTLFRSSAPYVTSGAGVQFRSLAYEAIVRDGAVQEIAVHRLIDALVPGDEVGEMTEALVGHQHARTEDRKSTRLNSSHVKISYAVFCLK